MRAHAARSPIGNGSLLASFDLDYQIRDFYYPGSARKIMRLATPGASVLWLAGEFSWLDRHNWKLERTYVPDTLVTAVTASHPRLPQRLHFNDAVDYEKNILLRQVWVQNLSDRPLEPRLFFHTDINALENEIGDTVFFEPESAVPGILRPEGGRLQLFGQHPGRNLLPDAQAQSRRLGGQFLAALAGGRENGVPDPGGRNRQVS